MRLKKTPSFEFASVATCHQSPSHPNPQKRRPKLISIWPPLCRNVTADEVIFELGSVVLTPLGASVQVL
jgi:hypothetical protein